VAEAGGRGSDSGERWLAMYEREECGEHLTLKRRHFPVVWHRSPCWCAQRCGPTSQRPEALQAEEESEATVDDSTVVAAGGGKPREKGGERREEERAAQRSTTQAVQGQERAGEHPPSLRHPQGSRAV
jgi:hypothetical protein